MATLEKIRNKSVLLFVIIVVALLAFILGDFLTSYFNFGIATEGFVFNAGNAPAYPVLVTPAVAPVPAVIPMMPEIYNIYAK